MYAPEGQVRVPSRNRGSNTTQHLLTEQPRLAALRVDVGVGAEERLPGPGLVPPLQQLRVRVAEETAHIGAGEGQAGEADGEQHRGGGAQVLPVGGVVAGPDSAVALCAGVEGARQHERALAAAASLHLAFRGGHLLVDAVQVVPLAVFRTRQVQGVLRRRAGSAVESLSH